MNKKVIVGLSGGIDSSIASCLLLEQGYEVIGVTLLFSDFSKCCSVESISRAKMFASKLNFKWFEYSVKELFKEKIIKNFIEGHKNFNTPNPCVFCNPLIKFDVLAFLADQHDASFIATGHYVKKVFEDGRFLLKKGKDLSKDQSYFLYRLNQKHLSKSLFPLGDYLKKEVQEIAVKSGVDSFYKKESQDICFIDIDLQTYLKKQLKDHLKQGNIIHINGKILGKHEGLELYTIGQRSGLKISYKNPLYVIEKREEDFSLIVGEKEFLYKDTLLAKDASWIYWDNPPQEFKATASIRYRAFPSPCKVKLLDNDKIEIKFDNPQSAITKGQSVVLYNEDYLIGGGIIF